MKARVTRPIELTEEEVGGLLQAGLRTPSDKRLPAMTKASGSKSTEDPKFFLVASLQALWFWISMVGAAGFEPATSRM